ncbi:MAG: hypothetical protein V3U43_09890, partial [Pseudomonadales bacterium]
ATTYPSGTATRADHPNKIAVASLVLSCAVVFQLILAGVIGEPHRLEMESLQERVDLLQGEGMSPFAAAHQASLELYEDHGGAPPGWMIVCAMLYIGGGVAWIATIVCGLIAVRRPQRRRLAVTALIVAGLVPIVLCCGALPFGPGT